MESFAGKGNRSPPKGVDTRPERLQVAWEKPVESKLNEAGQARMQMRIHVKVVGLLLVQRGHVPTRMLS